MITGFFLQQWKSHGISDSTLPSKLITKQKVTTINYYFRSCLDVFSIAQLTLLRLDEASTTAHCKLSDLEL